MKLDEIVRKCRPIVLGLFPTVRAYLNFTMLLVFATALYYQTEKTLVVILALGVVYFLNEWMKEVER